VDGKIKLVNLEDLQIDVIYTIEQTIYKVQALGHELFTIGNYWKSIEINLIVIFLF
jgi:hypothetical protein